ncbi:MAG: 4-hydroxybenzoate 3-monooxygenase [Acidimicrobiales bacterium]
MPSTEVAIIGAGPAGLMLSHLLAGAGVSSVVLEARDRDYVQHRVRAGVLEQGSVDLLTDCGAGNRLAREGLVHTGVNLQFEGHRHRIDLSGLTGGKAITVYGQQRLVGDLIDARLAAGGDVRFETPATGIIGIGADRPAVRFRPADGTEARLDCDWVAGCDGSFGVSRAAVPETAVRVFERTYPFAWLGVLAEVAPSTDELIYSFHTDGFALHSLRSPELSRLYLQVAPDEDLEAWSDDRVWDELARRLASPGWTLQTGPITEKSLTPMRSLVIEPMRHGRLVLAGDAAHVVPPTGAKGLNLALADVTVLAAALTAWYRGDPAGVDSYSDTCLRRVWRVQDFSTYLTGLMHVDPGADRFERRVQAARQRYVTTSPTASAVIAENYVGLAVC